MIKEEQFKDYIKEEQFKDYLELLDFPEENTIGWFIALDMLEEDYA